ncbi:Di-copper centre-containing protein [Pleomassaria siparia CBS 279.74]|uniref:tyrosinase n=1 Tax=Pleomassaria siparia CBS 279.74 TaxID=1314801 RepID=A0A6G1JXQ0_9PLEO|nr:Di-copper centre-containing protein [Pleomassaria siparia CBS 279.74]
MWLTSLLFGLFAAATLINCNPIIFSNAVSSAGDLAGRHLVTGLGSKDAQRHVHIRHDIHHLKKDFPDQWNLYLLGLRAFQDSEQTSPISYYEIAGIHGRPYKVWQDAQGLPDKMGGYCPHKNSLFLAWHRPYVALFEQEMYRIIQEIASRSPPQLRDRFTSAATSFRLPYWDWSLGDKMGSIPDYFLSPTIRVYGVDEQNVTISNPLYRYDFHPIMPGDFPGQWASWNNTLRWPTSKEPNAISQDELFAKDFGIQGRSWRDQVSKGFTIPATLNEFSKTYIEEAHGWVHFSIGGGRPESKYEGHMWPVDFSAFEPLFMLLHCNADRLLALWQVANPDSWFVPESVGPNSNFVISENQIVDGTTPLSPFWRDSKTFWTVDEVRDTTVLGYAYPETQSWKFASTELYRNAVTATISQLYSSSARDRLTAGSDGQRGDLAHLNANNTFTDWSINAFASRNTSSSIVQVQFSLVADVSSDPPKNVGIWNAMMPSAHSNDGNNDDNKLNSMNDIVLKGSIGLTADLLDCIASGRLESLEAVDVVPFLKTRLTWNVYGDHGDIPNHVLDGLTVQVTSAMVHIPDDPSQPLEYDNAVAVHTEITDTAIQSARE